MELSMTWATDLAFSVVGNVISAGLIAFIAIVLWPSRLQLLAALRRLVRVRDVGLYLSMDGSRWNIEVPFRYVNDVRWRLRKYHLRSTNFITSMTADDYTEPLDFRIAAYDQSYQDDVVEIEAEFKRLRISMHVIGDMAGPSVSDQGAHSFSG